MNGTGSSKRLGLTTPIGLGPARTLMEPDVLLGNEPALTSGNGRRAPDRRRVSMRWMSGSILTGVTSTLLMGGALYAAVDGRQQMSLPASILQEFDTELTSSRGKQAVLGDRPVAIVALQPRNEKILQVPTVTRVGDSNVIRKKPFTYVSAPLAIVPTKAVVYPAFNPLTVFRSSKADTVVASSDVIYGADVESEVRIQQEPFPLATATYDTTTRISAFEAERVVRQARASLTDGEVQTAALPYLDTSRFVLDQSQIAPTSGLDIKIVAENVSTATMEDAPTQEEPNFSEEVIVVPAKQAIGAALAGLALDPVALGDMIAALASEIGTGPLAKGTKLRVAWEQQVKDIDKGTSANKLPRRISVYRSGQHLKSIARNDTGNVVWANEPSPIPATAADDKKKKVVIETVARTNLPNVYDGIFRAAFSQGLTADHAKRIVRTVAFDVDFKTKIKPSDDLEIFYSLAEGKKQASAESEILYIGLAINKVKRTYYRFKSPKSGRVDYYDSEGKSAKKFLLRKPVPNARFGSPFGMRRHPISRTYKMHSGVDFSAPRGTPILAAGNGIVEKAGWGGGCGKRTVIRHANGYKSFYCHQRRIAKGVREGKRVRQGQVIGQVGSTGYSTGPHLHYEVTVNGRKVNPMKIRLPQGNVLKGKALASFKRERDRINALLDKGRSAEQTVAALN